MASKRFRVVKNIGWLNPRNNNNSRLSREQAPRKIMNNPREWGKRGALPCPPPEAPPGIRGSSFYFF